MFDRDEDLWSIRWDEICRVVAFKLDRLSYDTICFGFQRRDEHDRVWCIEEDWDGYKLLVPEIHRLTKNAWSQKFSQIAHPAFEFNWTIVWEQPHTPPLNNDPILIWLAPPEKADPIG